MKTLLVLINSLTLSALVLTTQAQAPATSHANSTPAKPTAKLVKGVKGGNSIGQQMVAKSKPTDMLVPVPARPAKK